MGRQKTGRKPRVKKTDLGSVFWYNGHAMYDIVTIGDIKLDTFVILDEGSVQCQLRMPQCQLCLEYGAKIIVDVVASQIAGTAPNIATGLSRMGMRAAVVSNMGKDATRALALETLKKEKVGTKFIHIAPKEQSAYSVVLNFKGEKTLLTSHIRHTYHYPKHIKSRWLLVGEMGPGYESLYRSVAAQAKGNGVLIAANPGTIQIMERKAALFKLLEQTHTLFVNLEEARVITGGASLELHHVMRELWKLGPRIAVITDGKNGSYSFDGKELLHCPIFPGRMVEATGAGDAFATGYLGALMQGQLHDEALAWGAVNATSVVGKVGPTAGLLSTNQIREKLRKRRSFHAELM
jgi:ribokinase/sulfofructose kinase